MNLKVRIVEAGFPTQESFARTAGVDQTKLSRIIRGLVEPSAEEVERIEETLEEAKATNTGPLDVERIREAYSAGTRVASRSEIERAALCLAILDALLDIRDLLAAGRK